MKASKRMNVHAKTVTLHGRDCLCVQDEQSGTVYGVDRQGWYVVREGKRQPVSGTTVPVGIRRWLKA
jgi:hypothetical protein